MPAAAPGLLACLDGLWLWLTCGFTQLHARRAGRPLTRRPVFSRRPPSLFGDARDRLGPYELKSTLGEGTFSKVKLGQHAVTGEYFAIKLVRRSELVEEDDDSKPLVASDGPKLREIARDFRREIDILRSLYHPNIIQLYEMFETDDYYVVVLEYCPGGDLFEAVSKRTTFDEQTVKWQFVQLSRAVKELHDRGIAHRDLKLENVLQDKDGNVKIGDFGLARFVPTTGSQLLNTFCGSPDYAAPEVLKGLPYDGKMSDMWSMGVIVYALVTGCFPFEHRRDALEARYYNPDMMPEACGDLVDKLLRLQPESRLTIDRVLSHPWLQEDATSSSFEHLHTKQPTYVADVDGSTHGSHGNDRHVPHTIVSM